MIAIGKWTGLILLLFVSQAISEQCYDELGCFPNGYPWNSWERPVPPPKDPQSVGTKIYAYSRESTERFNITLWPKIFLKGFPFSASRKNVFVTHGFLESGNASWMDLLKDNYLKERDVNVFLVDWGPGSLNNTYPQAVANIRIVAAEVARFLGYLRDNYGLAPDQVHLIGFSLGAQLMSYVSNRFGKVYWITGLDPARPGFEGLNKTVRLDDEDATEVECVHTSTSPVWNNGFGYAKPCGNKDFYINQGRDQPGCVSPPSPLPANASLGDLLLFTTQAITDFVSCSHLRATWYYSYAVHNCTIMTRKATDFSKWTIEYFWPAYFETEVSERDCTNTTCMPLGLQTISYPMNGIFLANTTSSAPYCRPPEQ